MQGVDSGERAGSKENVSRRRNRKVTLRAAGSEVFQGQESCATQRMPLSFSEASHMQAEGMCSALLA